MKEFTGKTVDLAIAEGLNELGLKEEDVVITVVEEGTKGILGLGKKAVVRIEKKVYGKEKVIEFLNGLFEKLDIVAKVEVKESEDKIVFEIITTSSPFIIGYRGEILDSIQTMVSAIYNSGKEDYSRVVVDCENYRSKREETLKGLANKLADKAVRYGKKVALEPMNPFERRIIHSALSENSQVKTESNGVEPERYVVIIPENWDGDEREIKERAHQGNHGKSNDRNNRKGGRKDGKKGNGFKSEMIRTTQKTSGFGTFLGNSKNQ